MFDPEQIGKITANLLEMYRDNAATCNGNKVEALKQQQLFKDATSKLFDLYFMDVQLTMQYPMLLPKAPLALQG